MDSEDELASVLGHEVEHIDHYHCAERVQTQAALQKVKTQLEADYPLKSGKTATHAAGSSQRSTHSPSSPRALIVLASGALGGLRKARPGAADHDPREASSAG